MGQKTHPIGFRLGATRTWSSRWFATKGYAGLLHEDVKIRRFIKSSLYHAGISRIDIERSAIANAEHNHQVRDLDDLRVTRATADGGPSMKRVSPRAMGRAFFVKHRTSHLTIELSDEPARPSRAAQR